jgi:hypothetical protein
VTDQLLLIASGFPAGATVFFYMRFAGYTWTIGTNSAGDNGVAYFVYTVPKTIDSYSLVNQTVGFVAFNPAVGETNTVSGLVTIYPPEEFTISAQKLPSKLELRATDVNGNDITSGTEPLDIILRGRLTDAVNGWGLVNRRVYIYENGAQIGYATTDAAGAFVMTVTRNRGTYTYYAEWAGDDTYEGC